MITLAFLTVTASIPGSSRMRLAAGVAGEGRSVGSLVRVRVLLPRCLLGAYRVVPVMHCRRIRAQHRLNRLTRRAQATDSLSHPRPFRSSKIKFFRNRVSADIQSYALTLTPSPKTITGQHKRCALCSSVWPPLPPCLFDKT